MPNILDLLTLISNFKVNQKTVKFPYNLKSYKNSTTGKGLDIPTLFQTSLRSVSIELQCPTCPATFSLHLKTVLCRSIFEVSKSFGLIRDLSSLTNGFSQGKHQKTRKIVFRWYEKHSKMLLKDNRHSKDDVQGKFQGSFRLKTFPTETIKISLEDLMDARVDNPGNSIGGHRSSTTVPSVATSVALTSFAVGNGGHRWAIDGDRWATDGPSVGYNVPSMKGPQRLVTLVETAETFYKHRHTCTDHLR